MQEIVTQARNVASGIWAWRWTLLLVGWGVCVAGWIVVHLLPDQYTATARVHVDTQSVLRPLLKGITVETDVKQQVQIMTRTLLSRPNLEKVARMTDLDLKAKNAVEMEELLEDLAHHIVVEDTGKVNLYQLSYSDKDPRLAKRVIQSVLTIFVENTLGETRKDTDVATQFLDEQIKGYLQKLDEADQKLADFKREHVGMMPTQGKSYYDTLQEVETQLKQARLDLREAENRRNELKRQLQDESEATNASLLPKATAKKSTPEIDARIQSLQSKLDNLKLQYTEKHPDVTALQRTIAELQKQREAELAAQPSDAPESTSINPVLSQVKIALGDAEATVAGLRIRAGEYERRVAELRSRINTVPQVEADLTRLNRDYEVNKKNYDDLVARRESAKISEQAGERSDDIKFKIVDPPFVPPEPSGPNRPLLSSGVLIAGIIAGIAFAFFMSQIRPTFNNRRQLMEVTGIPVLGSVSMVWTDEQSRKRRLGIIGFAIGGALLLMVYGGVLTIELLNVDVLGHLKGLI